jgi:hypothetical protein
MRPLRRDDRRLRTRSGESAERLGAGERAAADGRDDRLRLLPRHRAALHSRLDRPEAHVQRGPDDPGGGKGLTIGGGPEGGAPERRQEVRKGGGRANLQPENPAAPVEPMSQSPSRPRHVAHSVAQRGGTKRGRDPANPKLAVSSGSCGNWLGSLDSNQD